MQPISTFPISDAIKRRLHDAGIHYVEDILSEQCRSQSWIQDIVPMIKCNVQGFRHRTALDEWQIESQLPAIVTFSQALDKAFGCDGVPLGSVTELCGLAGAGKTQMCLQLCADVAIPSVLGGLQGESLFIDTNTNFTPHRLEEIVRSCVNKCCRLLTDLPQDHPDEFTVESVLKSIHYIQTIGSVRFAAFLHNLPEFIEQNRKIKLIVIDSIVFPFKDGHPEFQRTGFLFRMMAALQKIASERRIAIVITNEMTTRIGLSGEQVVAGLGDAWAHRCNFRVILSKPSNATTQGERRALMVKNIMSAQTCTPFQITKHGIRDLG